MNRKKVLPVAAYSAFFWLWFWLFCYWTFPYDRLGAFLSQKVADSGSGYTLEIGELSPHWLTGVALSDVKIRKQSAAQLPSVPAEKGAKKDDDAIRVREARARMGVLSLLFGGQNVSFGAELEQGEIDGQYEEDGEAKRIQAELDKIDLGKLGVLDALVSLPVKGTLQGELDLTLAKEATQSHGTVQLTMKELTFGDGEAKLKVGSMGGLTIDPIEAGNVTVALDVKDGVGRVQKLSADGKDVELQGSGEVRFADPLSRSRLDIVLQIKFTDAYKNKSSRTKALFSLLDGATMPQVRAAKTPEGALAYRLTGTLAMVRAVPAARSVGATTTTTTTPRVSPSTRAVTRMPATREEEAEGADEDEE